MTDRGRLISLLSEIAEYFGGCRENASFGSKAEEHFWELKNAAMEAAELLKAQEPIPCGEKIKAGDVVLDFYECGYCKNAIRKPWRYCPFCGKEVKWND